MSSLALRVSIVCLLFVSAASAADSIPPEPPITDDDRSWWGFKPVERPKLPASDNTWSHEPVDRFILNRLTESNLQPASPASRETLLRRVTFDLSGLPPTPEELNDFVNDDRPDAYERVVDRLLASPSFGERWAQHWLDLARFAETDGFEHDKTRPNAWRYRDWVVDALNEDISFGDFVRQQIAGDLIAPNDAATVIATGFLLAGPDMPDINSQDERLHNFLNEMTGTVGSAFLGVQLGCAQCHDHKTDPISQLDFYRFRAHFENTDVFVEKPLPNQSNSKSKARSIRRMAKQKPNYLRVKGDFRRRGPEVQPASLRIAAEGSESKSSIATFRSSRPRKQLAELLAGSSLAHRTMVNRLWQHHFGKGIAETPSDFGYGGAEPTHPDLLNWLADDFARVQGRMKSIHRQLVCSSTYRMASDTGSTSAADPGNDLLWKMRRRRLDGESIRDAMLFASGQLNRSPGGPGIRPPLPKEITGTLLKNQWPVSKNKADHARRSIYIFARRNLRFPIFDVFDKPDGNASCARRNESVTAPQSLTLFNSEFSMGCAQRLAASLSNSTADSHEFVCEAYRVCLSRLPTENENEIATRYLATGGEKTRAMFCLSLLNVNEFVYVD